MNLKSRKGKIKRELGRTGKGKQDMLNAMDLLVALNDKSLLRMFL